LIEVRIIEASSPKADEVGGEVLYSSAGDYEKGKKCGLPEVELI
jgi:hypothetical protein